MFQYKKNQLYIENVSAESLAQKWGTPLYVYSAGRLLKNFHDFDQAFRAVPHLICYALKANSNLSLARILSHEGAGTDIVSAGELFRALKAGFPPSKIVFSGVGKTRDEMRAAIQKKILMFNVESLEELDTLNDVARSMKAVASVALRVNPEVEADTHHHITTGTPENKFGIRKKFIFDAYRAAGRMKNIRALGLQAHIGSQITSVKPFVQLVKTLLTLTESLANQGINLRYLDIGGGLGITYRDEKPPSPFDLARALEPQLIGRNMTLLFEPGRFLVGNAGILLTRVLYRKHYGKKTFLIVDAAMNELARPALYDAYHHIAPVKRARRASKIVDIVGPVCESGDYLARGRRIPFPEQGELLAVENAGAYGFAMSSQYNSRPRAAEVIVHGNRQMLARKRETLEDLIRGEK